VVAWALTFFGAVPAHRRLADGFDAAAQRSLIAFSLLRSVAWSAHGAVVIALLAAAL
jgi:hypothetical protein